MYVKGVMHMKKGITGKGETKTRAKQPAVRRLLHRYVPEAPRQQQNLRHDRQRHPTRNQVSALSRSKISRRTR
jgi:hypothetical protein